MKKRTIKRLAVCSAALLAVILCGFHFVSIQSTPAYDACEKIQIGMTGREVDAILSSYGNGTFTLVLFHGTTHFHYEDWCGDDGVLSLQYEFIYTDMYVEMKVIEKEFSSASDSPRWYRPTLFDRLRSSLGW
jgi:hypothetical protein